MAKTGSWDLYRMEADVAGPLIEKWEDIRGKVGSSHLQMIHLLIANTSNEMLYTVSSKPDVTDATRLSLRRNRISKSSIIKVLLVVVFPYFTLMVLKQT